MRAIRELEAAWNHQAKALNYGALGLISGVQWGLQKLCSGLDLLHAFFRATPNQKAGNGKGGTVMTLEQAKGLAREMGRDEGTGAELRPHWDKPCAAAGLLSYRYAGRYGWIMIGAVDDADALREAARSTDNVTVDKLQKWNAESGVYEAVSRG